jgi:mannose-6-phosphate isomerase-like protein (cupin superfamily)
VDATHPLHTLAIQVARHLRAHRFDDADERVIRCLVDDLTEISRAALPRQRRPGGSVRALQYAPMVLNEPAPRATADLHAAAVRCFTEVHWTEFYGEDDWSRPFLSLFSCAEGIGPEGRLAHDSLIVGLYLYGPGMRYPQHAHPADEVYVVLAGRQAFQIGAHASFIAHGPGAVVVLPADSSHAIRTEGGPAFGVFLRRGDIGGHSWYRADMTDDASPKRFPTIAG